MADVGAADGDIVDPLEPGLQQGVEPEPPSPYDRTISLELSESDEAMIEGRGPCQVVEYEVGFSGTLHVFTDSELDLFLRVEDAAGAIPCISYGEGACVMVPSRRREK